MKFYRLDDSQEPVACESHDEYFRWLEAMPDSSWWYVRKTGIGLQIKSDTVGDSRVSTVFLGLDHGYGDRRPVLFETMTFPRGRQSRYSSLADAIHGHAKEVGDLSNE